jgi:hypothetical protein
VSHDFAFWDGDDPLENEEAGKIFKSLIEEGNDERVKPSARIALLANEIETRWPMPGRGSEDDWPLAAPPDVSAAHMVVQIVPSRLWDVWPTLGQFAEQYELIMYDPQQEHVFLPRRLSRKRTRARAKRKRQADR